MRSSTQSRASAGEARWGRLEQFHQREPQLVLLRFKSRADRLFRPAPVVVQAAAHTRRALSVASSCLMG